MAIDVKTALFACEDEQQYATVSRHGSGQRVQRRRAQSHAIVDELACPVTSAGCAIEEIAASPSASWLVTRRSSGQGEWGYDVIRSLPLGREAGTLEEHGYMLELPRFSADESLLVGGFGAHWLGGWWAHLDDDDYDAPSRGGRIGFGFLLVHHLPSHRVERHELCFDLPKGWYPDGWDTTDVWGGASAIGPVDDGVQLTIPGGVVITLKNPLLPVILLPTPHPTGGRLL